MIFNVFQEMLFVFPDEYDENVEFIKNWTKIKIELKSTKNSFNLNFYFSESQAITMTENFLGQSDDISSDLIDETLKETANVIGGNFLNIFKKNYSLGIPEILDCEDIKSLRNQYDDGNGILLKIEEEPFLLLVN